MEGFKAGLYNYRTTITGLLTVLFGALSQTYPEWVGVFDKLRDASFLAFALFVKDASTGSKPY